MTDVFDGCVFMRLYQVFTYSIQTHILNLQYVIMFEFIRELIPTRSWNSVLCSMSV